MLSILAELLRGATLDAFLGMDDSMSESFKATFTFLLLGLFFVLGVPVVNEAHCNPSE